jgi:hypothetical protein
MSKMKRKNLMKSLRKFSTLFVAGTALFLVFGLSSPAMADSTTDYNQKVAEAQAKTGRV